MSQWGVDMWQKVLSKLYFTPNNTIGRGRKERKKKKKKEKGREEESLVREAPPFL